MQLPVNFKEALQLSNYFVPSILYQLACSTGTGRWPRKFEMTRTAISFGVFVVLYAILDRFLWRKWHQLLFLVPIPSWVTDACIVYRSVSSYLHISSQKRTFLDHLEPYVATPVNFLYESKFLFYSLCFVISRFGMQVYPPGAGEGEGEDWVVESFMEHFSNIWSHMWQPWWTACMNISFHSIPFVL